jgi:hypothetical protein
MAKKTTKKRGAADESSPFVMVRSKTGRSFQRCGIRFEPDRDEPVNLDKLTEAQREQLLSTSHLTVVRVTADEYEQALAQQATDEAEQMEDIDVTTLLAELAELRAEIALLTGRRPRLGGPRENDDKPAGPKPLIG